jgi:hypothetical protein
VNCVRAKRLVLVADEIVVNHKPRSQRSTPERLKFGQDLLALLEAGPPAKDHHDDVTELASERTRKVL